MRRFAELWAALDAAPAARVSLDAAPAAPAKAAALAAYFRAAPPEDAAWAVWLLTGRQKRLLPVRQLAGWAAAAAGVPDWLFEESYAAVGDLAETAALLLDGWPDGAASPGGAVPLAAWLGERLPRLRGRAPEEQRELVLGWWGELNSWEAFVLNRLLAGGLRVASPGLVERALAEAFGLPVALVGHRLSGAWEPSAAFFAGLAAPASGADLLAGLPAAGEAPPEDPAPAPSSDPPAEPEPYRIAAVLTYAQPGAGGRGGPLSDYTFGVWSEGQLVTLARATAGLSDAEVKELDRWIRRHTTERFGPVRAVEPVHVFEVAFAGLARAPRRRSGLAVTAPRIVRRRPDLRPEEAATLDSVEALLDRD